MPSSGMRCCSWPAIPGSRISSSEKSRFTFRGKLAPGPPMCRFGGGSATRWLTSWPSVWALAHASIPVPERRRKDSSEPVIRMCKLLGSFGRHFGNCFIFLTPFAPRPRPSGPRGAEIRQGRQGIRLNPLWRSWLFGEGCGRLSAYGASLIGSAGRQEPQSMADAGLLSNLREFSSPPSWWSLS